MNKTIQTTQAKKHLGQNFLTNPEIIDSIIQAAQIQADDFVVEIGPGTGNLTRAIHQKTSHYLGIETDKSFQNNLKQFNVTYQDALQFDKSKLPKKYKILANIPYYISSPLINYYLKDCFIHNFNQAQSLTLMLQKEVANKILDNKKKSILSIQVEAFGTAKKICDVDKSNFVPVPKVDSSVLHIQIKPKWEFDTPPQIFFQKLKLLFASKRKTIKNNLKAFPKANITHPKIQDFLGRRAESLSLQELDQICYNLVI